MGRKVSQINIPVARLMANGKTTRQQSFDGDGRPEDYEEWAYWAETKRPRTTDGLRYVNATEGLAVGFIPRRDRPRLYRRTRSSTDNTNEGIIDFEQLAVFSSEDAAVEYIEWMRRQLRDY